MSYKEKFHAAEHSAHNKIIATKILRDMTEHRSLVGDGNANIARRWIWELIQNAKDVNSGRVKINLDFNPNDTTPYVCFRHNGAPFTTNNIRYLIEQISDKDQKKEEGGRRKETGKFGTGFLTTHLLSEIVTVSGVAKEPELAHRKFSVVLDRSGTSVDEITESVDRSKKSVENLDELPIYSQYSDGAYNTAFYYPLHDSVSLNVAQNGLTDLSNCLPYTLAFVPEIATVEVPFLETTFDNDNENPIADDDIELIDIVQRDKSGKETYFTLACIRRGFTTIGIPVEEKDGGTSIQIVHDHVPKLFCDFPLIGTENLPFPVIVNNPNFNPTDPRDGVFLTSQIRSNIQVDENKKIMQEAVELYFHLLEYAAKNSWKNLHLLAQINEYSTAPAWIDKTWYNNEIVAPIRKRLLRTKIVNTADEKVVAILTEKDTKYTWFPSAGKREIRDAIWRSANQWFPYLIPRQIDVELWYKLSWKDCGILTLNQLAIFVEQTKSLSGLLEQLQHDNIYKWLNEFYSLLAMDENDYATNIQNRIIFPNQNGEFKKKSQLSYDEGDIGDDFKNILSLLGNDLRDKLADENIDIKFEANDTINQAYVVREITTEVNEIANDRERAKSYSEAFGKLLKWFRDYPEKAKSLFYTIYRNKHLLYDEDEIIENFNKAEQLNEIMTELNVSNMDELRKLLSRGQQRNTVLPVTEDILTSMGITSVGEWQEAIKDKDLASIYAHESAPTTDMFVLAQSLITKAKLKIIEHLETLPNYDLSNVEETAPTLLAGVIKDNAEITIVTRPAYNGEVIIYYGSERDILDYVPSELWVDDGNSPRKISLGHILKTARIVKFPI